LFRIGCLAVYTPNIKENEFYDSRHLSEYDFVSVAEMAKEREGRMPRPPDMPLAQRARYLRFLVILRLEDLPRRAALEGELAHLALVVAGAFFDEL
jgi:hypothetical protein